MKAFFLPILVAASLGRLWAQGHESLPALAVQAVIFQVPSDIGLNALETATTQDPVLFEQLVAMVAAGKAQIVFDQTLTKRSGQTAKGHASREFMYPTEHEPNAKLFQAQPTAFNMRRLGDRFECDAVLWSDRKGIDATFKIETVSLKRIEPCATPNISGSGPSMGGVDQPLFIRKAILAAVTLSPGRPMLIGLAPAVDIYESSSGPTAPRGTRLAFARSSILGNSEVRNPTWRGSAEIRLHSIGIRIPTRTAAKMLHDEESNAAKLLSSLVTMVRRDEATLVHHVAGVTRSGNRAHTEHVAEVIYADDFDPLIPTSFQARFVGSSTEFEATLGPRWEIDCTISIGEHTQPRERRRTIDLGNPALFTTTPEFPVTALRSMITVPQGGVCLLGAVSGAPGDDVSGRTPETADLYFLKAAPSAAPEGTFDLWPMLEQTALLYSVNESEAEALRSVLSGDAGTSHAAQELATRLEQGACHLAALATVVAKAGMPSKIESGVWGTVVESLQPRSGRSGIFARRPKREQCLGVVLETEAAMGPDGQTAEMQGTLRYDPAPRLDPSDEVLRAAVSTLQDGEDSLVESPVFTETFRLPKGTQFANGESRLLAVQPSLAPAGYPETGRWHALVMRVRLINR